MEELERHGKNIRAKIRAAFMPEDVKMLPKAQCIKIEEWCHQLPVLGFNSGRYDLNLIREHFAERLSDTTSKVRVARHGNKIMFLFTGGFRFLDIINYLGPGTSYESGRKSMNARPRNRDFCTSCSTHREARLSWAPRLSCMVFMPEGWLTCSRGMNGRVASICSTQGKGHAHLCRLAALLQKSGCGPCP